MLQQSDAQESEVRTFIREIRQYATIQGLDETVEYYGAAGSSAIIRF